MKIDEGTIRKAFKQHLKLYANPNKAWTIPHHIDMWNLAQKAFDGRSFPDFEKLYNNLKNNWQVFRGGASFWTAQELFDALGSCDSSLRTRKLSTISQQDVPAIWDLLQSVKDMKVNKHGPSVVAVSKFLHFWNPRLFMIVDNGVIWKWVFAHKWLWRDVDAVRSQTDQQIHGDAMKHDNIACDLSTYVAILIWAGKVLRDNPAILTEFEKYVKKELEGQSTPSGLLEYEAPAIEWLLLGLVELPPCGIIDLESAP